MSIDSRLLVTDDSFSTIVSNLKTTKAAPSAAGRREQGEGQSLSQRFQHVKHLKMSEATPSVVDTKSREKCKSLLWPSTPNRMEPVLPEPDITIIIEKNTTEPAFRVHGTRNAIVACKPQ
ncbi:hypothetical protein SETIT_6G000500v2 [Setaria italica]|uniref:Uncharacterized protein n=1 Tax=Setaria italica TaxID=4555 RepID=A0A368RGT9_SETIT|nr:hypothetical protein SETIT_6G000500v2 [Setaria italica]